MMLESLYAEKKEDSINRQTTATDTIGHSHIKEHHAHTQIARDQSNPSTASGRGV